VNAKEVAEELRPKVRASMAEVRAGLERLARVPSMSAPGYDAAPVRETAKLTADLFTAAGVHARVIEKDGAHPAVVGRIDGPAGPPTVPRKSTSAARRSTASPRARIRHSARPS